MKEITSFIVLLIGLSSKVNPVSVMACNSIVEYVNIMVERVQGPFSQSILRIKVAPNLPI